jgi:hypothetical protein
MTVFTFINTEGTILSPDEIQTISGSLSNNTEIEITIHYDGSTKSPGIFLTPSSTYGSILQPSNNSVYTDYNQLLSWGEDETPRGLYIKMQDESNDTQTYYFKYSQGSTYSNMIPLIGMNDQSVSGSNSYKIGFNNNNNAITQRLYVGFQVSDVS